MIYCLNSDCAKPRNQESSSFCSHCGTPLKIGDRFFLTEPLEEASHSFLATDQHLPSKPRCVVINRGELSEAAGWTQAQFARLESLGSQGHLPQLLALMDGPTVQGGSAPAPKLLAHAWMGDASLAQRQARDGAMDELALRQHLNTVLADLVQIHDQGFIHGDIRPSTLVQRSTDQRLLAASYSEIAPICNANPTAQGKTQDLQVLQYWAPERKLGQPVPASDLYSLGVSAIQLLTAQPLEKLFDVAEDCWCWEDSLETELSDGLKALLNCLLERATRRRYGSAVDVLRDLAHLDDLAELADLAEPIAPLQQPNVSRSSPQQVDESEAGATAQEKSSGDTTADLKESEIETLPLKKETPGQSNGSDSRSQPIGNAINDATPPQEAVGLEHTVIYGQFPKNSPAVEESAEPGMELEAEDVADPAIAQPTPSTARSTPKIRIPQSLIAEDPRETDPATDASASDLENRSSASTEHPRSGDAETPEEIIEESTFVSHPKSSDTSEQLGSGSQDALALEALDTLGLSKLPKSQPQISPNAEESEDKDSGQDPANLSIRESLETPTIPPQTAESDSSSRRSQQNTRELMTKVLANPLTISIGSLVQQLTQRYAAQGETYLPWEIMQSLKQLKRTPENQITFAAQLLEMANFYRDKVFQGHRDLRHLTIAIVSYEQALIGLKNDHPTWSDVCHDLGQMYLNLSRQHPNYRVACIKKSVRTFKRGLVEAEANDGAYLELQSQLGEAYGTLATCEAPAEHWQGAIAAYQAALAICHADAIDPTGEQELKRNERHGAIQNNLGTALWNLSLHSSNGETSEHLQGAIAAYNAALAHHDPDADPVRFGMIQNNLGTAYLNLAQSEKSIDLLRLATGTYQVALMYRKRREVPLAHAATQNNLGAASLQLASHAYADPQTQQESLEQSIIAYEAALELVRELSAVGATSLGFDPAASRLNLALAHQRRGCLSESASSSSVIFAHLETAMQIYLSLLEKHSAESEVHEMALEYLGQTMHYLSEHLNIADDHPLLTQVPNSVVAEMSQQFQRQLQRAS